MSVLPLTAMGHDRVSQGLGCLEKAGMTSGDWQQGAIDNCDRRMAMVAASRGILALPSAPLEQLVEREVGNIKTICDWADVIPPTEDEVAGLLGKVQKSRKGTLTPHDRIVPAGLDLPGIYEALYGFNHLQIERHLIPLKIYEERNKWWREDNVYGEPTRFSVFRTDFSHPFTIGMNREPFGLTHYQQIAWARDQGGDNITSVAETLYLFLRCAMENQELLWFGSTMRCRDCYGIYSSLDISLSDGNGIRVYYCDLGTTSWKLGALPRKSIIDA